MAKITLIGMYNYDTELFKNLTFPDGIDRDLVIDNILLQGGEFEVLYTDPEFLKYSFGIWARKWQRTFTKWVEALSIEYNPLENYDRIESYIDIGHNTSNVKSNGESTTNYGSTNTTTDTSSTTLTGGADTTNSVSAYDQEGFSNRDKSSFQYNNQKSTNAGDITTKNGGKDTSTGSNNSDVTDDTKFTHEARLHGNIGVTTSQQMLQSELDIATWNLYEHITDMFLKEFLLLVY